ncbi:MAG: hypothetical protein HFE64_05310 [Lachnospiraceae bacterium]|jgi:hypothetical protein|nr:hypothetical protein [Lachnospiraceae bacterium]
MKHKPLIFSLFCAILLCIGIYAFSGSSPKPFWQQLGAQREQVDAVRFTYHGQSVSLDRRDTTRFLDAISASEPAVISEAHEFTPCDITVTFLCGEAEYLLTFYWFPYDTMPGETPGALFDYADSYQPPLFERIGNRFDVIIDGQKYHYRFTGSTMWTEEDMRAAYNNAVSVYNRSSEQRLLSMAKLDGAAGSYSPGGLLSAHPYSLEEILSESDLIFLATHEGICIDRFPASQNPIRYNWDHFHIQEVLKGEANSPWYKLLSSSFGKFCMLNDQLLVAYPRAYAPDFKPELTYLICVKQTEDGDVYFGQYSTAVLDQDTLFPRFNTEDHPFYNISLSQLRERLASD